MKIIEIPKPVLVKPVAGNKEEPKPIHFREWLELHLDTYTQVKTSKQVRQLGKIYDAIEAANGTVSVEDADYDLIKAALEEPKYIPGIARQMVSYLDAVEKAQDVKK